MKINELDNFPPAVAWDTEFAKQLDNKLHIPHGEFVALGITDGERYWIYEDEKLLPKVFERLKKCKVWILQNSLYDLRQMTRFVPNLLDDMPFIWDTEIVEHYVRTDYQRYNLDFLARRWLGIGVKKGMYEALSEGTQDRDELIQYLCNDVSITYRVFERQIEYMNDEGLLNLYKKIDAPMIEILTRMTLRPVRVDVKAMEQWIEQLEQRVKELRSKFSFNPNSSQQIQQYFRMKYKIILKDGRIETLEKVAKTGRVGTEELAELVELKHLEKLVSTYGRTWLEKYVENEELYADAKVFGTQTGRITYQNPNLQQVPARNFPIYRTFIINHPNKVILVADISQQEPRITAYISNETQLQHYFTDNLDIHLAVAKKIFKNDSLTKENKHERDIGKAINLGISYGLTSRGLAERTGLDEVDADKIIDDYFAEFPNIANYITSMRSMAQDRGYVKTLLGRRMNINCYNWQWRNTAINYPIQGSGADTVKLWMIYIWKYCKKIGLEFPLLLTIHDEIVLEVDKDLVDDYIEIMKRALKTVSKIIIPNAPYEFEMEFGVGNSWACKK